MTRKKSYGFPTHSLGRFTHRQFGLKHAEFPGVVFKRKKKRKNNKSNQFCSYILITPSNREHDVGYLPSFELFSLVNK